MKSDRKLLIRFFRDYPFQPATALWRYCEIRHLLAQSDLPQGRGLDLGCGDGLLTRIVAEYTRWIDIVGVDPDEREAQQARDEGLYSKVHAVSAAALPEADQSFDWVFSNSVLEHVTDIDAVLKEAVRVLRPGGTMILTVPGPDFHRALRGPLSPWASRDRYLTVLDRRLAHLRYWTADEWRTHLGAAGVQVTEVSEYLSRAEVRRWESIARFTSGVLFAVFRNRRHPIEIQHSLGMRGARRRRLPAPIAHLFALIFARGLGAGAPPHGCLFVRATKPQVTPGT